MTQQNKPSTREMVALVISGTMVLVSIVYWIIQVSDVMEILKLAKGG